MQIVVPCINTWLVYEAHAKAEGRREPYSLDSILSKQILDGKLYVEERPSVNWHRYVQENGPKSEAYVGYTLALIDLEETLCSK